MVCPSCSAKLPGFLFYSSKDSFLRKLNPLVKLVLVLVVNALAFAIENIYANLALALVVAGGMFVAGVSFGTFRKMLIAGIYGLLLVVALAYLFSSQVPGSMILFVFPWGSYITERTILYVSIVYFRFLAACLISLIFLCTTRDAEVVQALRALRIPYSISFMMTLVLRSTSIVYNDWLSVMDAQRIRGWRLEGFVFSKLKKILQVSLPLSMNLLKRIEETNYAIVARGFALKNKKRTNLRQLRWTAFDITVLTAALTALVVVVIARYQYGYLTFA